MYLWLAGAVAALDLSPAARDIPDETDRKSAQQRPVGSMQGRTEAKFGGRGLFLKTLWIDVYLYEGGLNGRSKPVAGQSRGPPICK